MIYDDTNGKMDSVATEWNEQSAIPQLGKENIIT